MNGGMNAQRDQLQYFLGALTRFNDSLRGTMRDLEQRHDNVVPLWRPEEDEMRRRYDQQWEPLKQMMSHYIRVEGPGYVEFLTIKLHAVNRYLNNG